MPGVWSGDTARVDLLVGGMTVDIYDSLVEGWGYPAAKFARFAESFDYLLEQHGPLPEDAPYSILDSGFGWGISSVMLLRRYTAARVVCIDPYWPGTYSDARDIMLYQPHNLRERWQFVRGRLQDLGQAFAVGPMAFDLVMLDADHGYPSTLEQLEVVYPLLREGGRLFCHDAKEGVPVLQAIEEFERAHGVHFGRWPGFDENGWAWLRKVG